MMIKVLKWLHNWVQSKNQKEFLHRYYNTTKCPNCKKWSHEKFLDDQEDKIKLKEWGYVMKCGNCGNKSRWNTVAFPFPAICKKGGMPYSDKEIKNNEVNK